MNNNDILIRLRYALDIKDSDMIRIFNLGGVKVSKKELGRILTNPKKADEFKNKEEELLANKDIKECDNYMLESFLNGFITFKRGKKDESSTESQKNKYMIKDNKSVNNVMLKKIKIALTLTSEDMFEIFELSGITLSNSELSAVLRREGHRNYKECGDRYARNFLKGLAIKYRSE